MHCCLLSTVVTCLLSLRIASDADTVSWIGVLEPFARLFYSIVYHPVPENISIEDGGFTLSRRLGYVGAMCSCPETFPNLLIPQCKTLAGVITSDSSDNEVWKAISDFTVAATSKEAGSPLARQSKRIEALEKLTVEEARKHWNRSYAPASLEILTELVRKYEREIDFANYYAKAIVFIQSSGMGKSRLANEFGQSYPMISFVFSGSQDATPPGDCELMEVVRSTPDDGTLRTIRDSPSSRKLAGDSQSLSLDRARIIWYHSIAVGLLQASLESCKSFIAVCPSKENETPWS